MFSSKVVITEPEIHVTRSDGSILGRVLFNNKGEAYSITWTCSNPPTYDPYTNQNLDILLEMINRKIEAGYKVEEFNNISVCQVCTWVGLSTETKKEYHSHGRQSFDVCPQCDGSVNS